MKRLLIASLLGAFAFAASAQNTTTTDAQAQVETESAVANLDTEANVRLDADRNCIRYTGSRIVPRKMDGKDCVIATGRAYSRKDIERTGEIDIANALRKLDPAIH
ncbi:MAG: hypothetical protein M3374_06895 [Pseudomonadota bacterium]|nr:hypothetical protein [Pseudomonadota bacterium]